MTAVVGRAWGWVCSWGGGGSKAENTPTVTAEEQKQVTRTKKGWTSWLWGGWRRQSDHGSPVEEFWEAQEKLQPMEIEVVRAGKQEPDPKPHQVSRWWSKFIPTSYLPWPRKTEPSGMKRRKRDGRGGDDVDGDFSDYGTPPPSPTPSSRITSPFRLFVNSWTLDILPEHHEICFNFLRHLFDLFVVGFLWTVSPPTKLILEVLGVHGALRLWLHGMAMFFVSTVGMAGLLWLVQEYLPQFALIYGIIQALVISVSVRQSVLLDTEEVEGDRETEKEEEKVTDDVKEREHKEKSVSAKDKVKTS
ncbi:uncharacterized protein C6orf47 homolog [Xyrichtys novacula]|uniref:Uncharacterized protein C6orf47 homolog n=1 Tax=Xyrichtys novacula TaxID=13765 RepID=A0AAV1HEE7_XYRNO|nr:uncharacterized protein C6orf47 homolog [Xyrichtys novacula]